MRVFACRFNACHVLGFNSYDNLKCRILISYIQKNIFSTYKNFKHLSKMLKREEYR